MILNARALKGSSSDASLATGCLVVLGQVALDGPNVQG